uniref:Uncharacterized protein n=1 Tax=Octopus bimaculoides TaxID=37653 RepID=A0A0L8HB65_OCTBM
MKLFHLIFGCDFSIMAKIVMSHCMAIIDFTENYFLTKKKSCKHMKTNLVLFIYNYFMTGDICISTSDVFRKVS